MSNSSASPPLVRAKADETSFRLAIAILAATALVGVFTASALAQTQVCEPVDQSTETVVPGVTLTWDSSFRCDDTPDEGDYEITVTITNHGGSAEAVRIDEVQLSHTTPRPGGQGPEATAEGSGLPLVIAPGETGTFGVSGRYELIETDEGKKANLHLRAVGWGVDSAEPFALGINVQLRGPGAVEDGDTDADGPPLSEAEPEPTPTAEPTPTGEPPPEDGEEPAPEQPPPGDALEAFHEARIACLTAFFEALETFHMQRRAILEEIQAIARTDAEDKEEQIAALEAQLAELEAEKDAAEAEKDECVAEAEAAKDEALDDENGERLGPPPWAGPPPGVPSEDVPPVNIPPFDGEDDEDGRPGSGPPPWAGGPPPWAGPPRVGKED